MKSRLRPRRVMFAVMFVLALMSMAMTDFEKCKQAGGGGCTTIPDGRGSDSTCDGSGAPDSSGGGGGPPPPPAATATRTAVPTATSTPIATPIVTMSGSTLWSDGVQQGLGSFSNNVTVIGTVQFPNGLIRTLDGNGAHSWGTELCISFNSNTQTVKFDAAGQFLALGSQVSPYTLYANGLYKIDATQCGWGHALYGDATYLWQNTTPAISVQQALTPRNCSSLVPSPDLNVGWCDPMFVNN